MRWDGLFFQVPQNLQFRPISNNCDEPGNGRRTARTQPGSVISQITALKETSDIRGSWTCDWICSGSQWEHWDVGPKWEFTTLACPGSWGKGNALQRIWVSAYLISVPLWGLKKKKKEPSLQLNSDLKISRRLKQKGAVDVPTDVNEHSRHLQSMPKYEPDRKGTDTLCFVYLIPLVEDWRGVCPS